MTRPTSIHPTAIVAPNVTIGPGTIVGPFAVIVGPTSIGEDCWIGPSVVIGTTGEHVDEMIVQHLPDGEPAPDPESLWFGDHGLGVALGDRVIVRELSTIHSGTKRITRVGSDVFMMNKTYVAHDVQLGDRVRLAPHAAIGGHAVILDDANIGMAAGVHQNRCVGRAAMVGMCAAVVRDVRPFELVKGNPARGGALNRVWLSRNGYGDSDIAALERYFDGTGEIPATFAGDFAAWSTASSA